MTLFNPSNITLNAAFFLNIKLNPGLMPILVINCQQFDIGFVMAILDLNGGNFDLLNKLLIIGIN